MKNCDPTNILNGIEEYYVDMVIERYLNPEYFSNDEIEEITLEYTTDCDLDSLVRLYEMAHNEGSWYISKLALIERIAEKIIETIANMINIDEDKTSTAYLVQNSSISLAIDTILNESEYIEYFEDFLIDNLSCVDYFKNLETHQIECLIDVLLQKNKKVYKKNSKFKKADVYEYIGEAKEFEIWMKIENDNVKIGLIKKQEDMIATNAISGSVSKFIEIEEIHCDDEE